MNRLDLTNREIAGSLQRHRRQELERQSMLAPIRAIDVMVADLEELHLLGRKRVPEGWGVRLGNLGRALPSGCELGELRSRITIVHLMDRLYEIQDELLRRKTGGLVLDEDELSEAS
ncbi:MAG TPA: hypothetical protein VI316_05895 [Candidatus Dormibacteraeota bacterium]